MPYCPNCRDEFQDWVKICPDCQVPLVEELPELPEMKPSKEPLVHVATAPSESIAYMWAGILEDNGIKCLVKSAELKAAMYFLPTHQQHEIYVLKPSAAKAKKRIKPIVEHYNIEYGDIHNSGWSGRHFSTAFYIELEKKLGVKIKQTSLLPDLHLSKEEKSWMNQVEEVFNYKGKFWLINSGHKMDYPLKQWGHEYWQELVNLLRDKIQFVQIGERNKGESKNCT